MAELARIAHHSTTTLAVRAREARRSRAIKDGSSLLQTTPLGAFPTKDGLDPVASMVLMQLFFNSNEVQQKQMPDVGECWFYRCLRHLLTISLSGKCKLFRDAMPPVVHSVVGSYIYIY